MDSPTAEIITWDMSHLSQQQIEHLHALKNQALKENLRIYVANLKGAKS